VISETFAVRWHGRQLACRLIEHIPGQPSSQHPLRGTRPLEEHPGPYSAKDEVLDARESQDADVNHVLKRFAPGNSLDHAGEPRKDRDEKDGREIEVILDGKNMNPLDPPREDRIGPLQHRKRRMRDGLVMALSWLRDKIGVRG
jgi:hypothetical protein